VKEKKETTGRGNEKGITENGKRASGFKLGKKVFLTLPFPGSRRRG